MFLGRKKLINLLAVICAVGLLAGCQTSSAMSYTFNVDNGDVVKLELDTSDDYSITSQLPFTISCGEDTYSQGTFILGEGYDQYAEVARSDDAAIILEEGEKDGNEYIFWNYNDTEFNYVIKVADCDTAVLLGNNVSEESAVECFNRLTITAE